MATSKLSAVNTLLAIIGEAPINSLNPPLTGDASLAERTLDEVSREVQGAGWSWNTMLYDSIPLDASTGQSQLPRLYGLIRCCIRLKGLFFVVCGFLIALRIHTI